MLPEQEQQKENQVSSQDVYFPGATDKFKNVQPDPNTFKAFSAANVDGDQFSGGLTDSCGGDGYNSDVDSCDGDGSSD